MGRKVLVAYEDRRRAAKAAETGDEDTFALKVVRSHIDETGLAGVPDVIRDLIDLRGKNVAHWRAVLLRLARAGQIELRPENSMSHVKREDRALLIPGPQGTFLSRIRLTTQAAETPVVPAIPVVAHECGCGGKAKEEPVVAPVPGPLVGGAEERGITTDVGVTCKPFTRIERDPALFQACMIRAKQIGEFKDSRSFYELVAPEIVKRDSESFYVVCIDFRGQLRDFVEVAIGQRHKVGVDVEDILAIVILSKCDGFAIAHCHPSGHAAPSDADKKLTKLVRDAAAVACPNIPLVDHLVVGLNEAYSFADKKLHKYK